MSIAAKHESDGEEGETACLHFGPAPTPAVRRSFLRTTRQDIARGASRPVFIGGDLSSIAAGEGRLDTERGEHRRHWVAQIGAIFQNVAECMQSQHALSRVLAGAEWRRAR